MNIALRYVVRGHIASELEAGVLRFSAREMKGRTEVRRLFRRRKKSMAEPAMRWQCGEVSPNPLLHQPRFQ